MKKQKLYQWQILTCEYPPQIGGVSDYTKLVAEGLAEAGDNVHVWAPGEEQSAKGKEPRAKGKEENIEVGRQEAGVTVHREFGRFRPRDLRRVGKQLAQFPAPRRILVQWVPHGYGYRSMNLPFAFWLWRRAKFKRDRVELMVHEPFLAFREGSRKQDIVAAVHRLMTILILNAASQIWISSQEWEGRLQPFLLGRKKRITWLPVPSNIPLVDDPAAVAQVRARYATNGTRLVGHFGAYNDYMTDLMSNLLPSLLNGDNDLSMLLLGNGSVELRERLIESYPQFAEKLFATGEIPAAEVSKHISACDVMLQPYQDGMSGRRTSAMSALSHGLPVITNSGKATESCWVENDAVLLLSSDDPKSLAEVTSQLAQTHRESKSLRISARHLYETKFALSTTVSRLRNGAS